MSGTRDLVGRLHASEGSRLMRFFRASLRSPQDAADATQETFLRLMGAPRLDAIANPQAYLFAVARSVAIAIDRHAARDRVLFAASSDPEAAACPGPDVERLIAARQELALLARAIRQLPRRCQQVFILSRLHGLSNGDIAARLGISRNMVEKHIMRALLSCAEARRGGVAP